MWGPSVRYVGLKLYDTPKDAHTVLCPRKGPLGATISVVVCGTLHSMKPEFCAENNCNKAAFYAKEIKLLHLLTKHTTSSYSKVLRLVEGGAGDAPCENSFDAQMDEAVYGLD